MSYLARRRLTVLGSRRPGSTGLIPTVSSLSCGAVLFIPVSHVSASPARVLQSNLPPLSLATISPGNTYFLPPAPPRPPAVRWRGEERRGGTAGVERYVSCAFDGRSCLGLNSMCASACVSLFMCAKWPISYEKLQQMWFLSVQYIRKQVYLTNFLT